MAAKVLEVSEGSVAFHLLDEHGNKIEKPEKPTKDAAIQSVDALVQPKASSLYNAYTLPFRYFVVADNTQRLALVAITVFLSPNYPFSGLTMAFVNLVYFVLIVTRRPYIIRSEQVMASLIAGSDGLACLYTTLLWLMPTNAIVTGEAFGIAVVVLTGIVPILCGVVMIIIQIRLSFCNPVVAAEEEKQRKEQAMRNEHIEQLEEWLTQCDPFGNDEEEHCRIEEELNRLKNPPPSSEERLTDTLDGKSKKIILFIFTTATVPVLLVAAALAGYGTITAPPSEFAFASHTYDRTIESVLGSRPTWDAYLSQCCCINTLPLPGFNLTERWVCALPPSDNYTYPINGNALASSTYTSDVTVTRNRQATVISNGLALRGLCRNEFLLGCVVTTGGGDAALECNASLIAEQGVSSLALDALW
jgi:hypothetical protein